MPAATASGADTGANGSAKSRDHNQGNQERKYTVEQKAAVIRVRRCPPTAFYDILGLETVKTTVTDSEIKKAYRKLSLLTHPDKNGHEHADEAFKMVSRAFGVLSDPDKKSKFDRFGGDPDSRFGGQSSAGQSPFNGFPRRQASGTGPGFRGQQWDDEISPEEMFNRFFGGGGMGGGFGPFGGGMFDTGPQFVFNLGGGPGINVHQFGGARPRRRPREETAEREAPASLFSTITGLLPLLILFVIPLLSSIFSGGDDSGGPTMRFDQAVHPHVSQRTTPKHNIDYWINPRDVADFSPNKFTNLDRQAEVAFVRQLGIRCEQELVNQQRMLNDAQGWLFIDTQKEHEARNMELPSCKKLDDMKIRRNNY